MSISDDWSTFAPRRTLHECVDWNEQKRRVRDIFKLVALYTSAWIEIVQQHPCSTCQEVALYTSAWIEMFPMPYRCTYLSVALYTSAWIEMISRKTSHRFEKVALYTSAWIEINKAKLNQDFTPSRTLHECVDWNTDQNGEKKSDFGRTLHECVDWNNRLKVSQR